MYIFPPIGFLDVGWECRKNPEKLQRCPDLHSPTSKHATSAVVTCTIPKNKARSSASIGPPTDQGDHGSLNPSCWFCPQTREYKNRLAMATFWRTLHHDAKFSPAWCEGGARPPPFTVSTITSNVVVYAPTERAYIPPPFLLYPFLLCGFV